MANYVLYTRANGTEMKLRINSERAVEFEERAKASLLTKITELDKLSVAADYIAAAIDGGDYETRKTTAYAIYDEMTEKGEGLQEYTFLIYDIMVASGFLKSKAVETEKETYLKAQELDLKKATALLEATDKVIGELEKKAPQKKKNSKAPRS